MEHLAICAATAAAVAATISGAPWLRRARNGAARRREGRSTSDEDETR